MSEMQAGKACRGIIKVDRDQHAISTLLLPESNIGLVLLLVLVLMVMVILSLKKEGEIKKQ